METTFECVCGADVRVRGEWKDGTAADLKTTCEACGRDIIVTVTALDPR